MNSTLAWSMLAREEACTLRGLSSLSWQCCLPANVTWPGPCMADDIVLMLYSTTLPDCCIYCQCSHLHAHH